MREMSWVDASILRDVGVRWDVPKFTDILQVVTVAGSNCAGVKVTDMTGKGCGGTGGEVKDRLLQQRYCSATNRIAGGSGV